MNILTREDVLREANGSGFRCATSCCSVPLKFCSTDMWVGDLLSFARAIEAAVLEKLGKAELPEPAHRGPTGAGTYFDSYTAEQLTAWGNTRFVQGAASQLSSEPACWLTPKGEGFSLRFEQPVTDTAMGWEPLFTLKDKP